MVELTALILAGGEGTRLRGVLPGIPKVLAPVCGRPFLSYLLDQVQAAGVREVVLCTGYRADQVLETFGTRYQDLELRYSSESRPLGTAGRSGSRSPRSRPRGSWCSTETPISIARSTNSIAGTLRARRRFPGRCSSPGRRTRVVLEPSSWVPAEAIRSFREKSRLSEAGWINTGVYLLRRSLLESIRPGPDHLARAGDVSALDRSRARGLHHPRPVRRYRHAGIVRTSRQVHGGAPGKLLEPGGFSHIRLIGGGACRTGKRIESWSPAARASWEAMSSSNYNSRAATTSWS